MDIVLIIFGPAIVTFCVLAPVPAGGSYVVVLGFFSLAWGLAANSIFPLDPPSGPDDWFHGIEVAGLFGALGAATVVSIAQGLRWWRGRNGKKPHYILTLIGVTVVAAGLSMTVGSF